MGTISRLAAAGLTLLLASTALAEGRTLTAAELDAYGRLRDARALADKRRDGPGGPERRTQAEAGFRKALADAGWSAERYEAADAIVGDVLSYLEQADQDPAEARSFWEGNEPVDGATIGLVKARRGQLRGAGQRAEQALRDEQESAVMGRPATRADLQGTWRLDGERTRAHLAGALKLGEAQVRDILKDQGEHTLAFAGDQFESRQVRAGRAEAWKGTFRVEGRYLVFAREKREEKLQAGLKSPAELVMGMFGVPTGIYLKQ
jgi:hypothetical protein